jgi:hypothetical protein
MCKCCSGDLKDSNGKVYECRKCGRTDKKEVYCCGEKMKEKK